MAIQFYNNKILFVDGAIAMDPACCCETAPEGACCPWFSEYMDIDLTGLPFSESSCSGFADHYVIGNFETDWLYGCNHCNNRWHDTFSTTSGSITITLEWWGSCDGINWRLRVYEYITGYTGGEVSSTVYGETITYNCGNNGSDQAELESMNYWTSWRSSCFPRNPSGYDNILITPV